MNYERYCEICMSRRIQPLGLKAFEAMLKAGFDFVSGTFN